MTEIPVRVEALSDEQLARIVEILQDPEKASALLDPAEREAIDLAIKSLRNVHHIEYRQVDVGFLAGRAMSDPEAPL